MLEDLLTQIGRKDLVENLNEFKSKCSFDCNAKSGSMGFQVDDSMEDVPDALPNKPQMAPATIMIQLQVSHVSDENVLTVPPKTMSLLST